MDAEIKKESNKALWITGIIVAIFVVGLITNGFGIFSPKSQVTGNSIAGAGLYIGTSPVLGDANAKLTIYEFSDFSCPGCKIASETVDPQIYNDYIKTGKVKVVFKYLKTHGQADPAHQVAYALEEQNATLFWEYKALAFQNQADLNDLDKAKALASDLGADMKQIDAFLASNKAVYLAAEDNQLATNSGLQGTPTYIVGNKIIFGAQDYSVYKKAIDSQI